MKVPTAVGVPLIVIVLAAQEAVTPAGRPVAVPIPVAPVVVWVMVVSKVLIQRVEAEAEADTVCGALRITFWVKVSERRPSLKIQSNSTVSRKERTTLLS